MHVIVARGLVLPSVAAVGRAEHTDPQIFQFYPLYFANKRLGRLKVLAALLRTIVAGFRVVLAPGSMISRFEL